MAAVDVKQLIQELIVPELREIKAEVKVIQTEIKRLEEKIDLQGAWLDEKIDTQGARLDDKIVSLRNEMLTEFRRLDEKIDLTLHVQERLVSLETRMSAYETRNWPVFLRPGIKDILVEYCTRWKQERTCLFGLAIARYPGPFKN